MKPSIAIEKFINYSVKSEKFDSLVLQEILDKISTEELNDYWMHFAASRAFSQAQSIPDWETKQQQHRFEYEHASYIYVPREKGANGKYIIDRKDLQGHIISCLNRYIHEGINKRIAFRNSPFIEKVRFYFAIASLILIIPYCVISILNSNKIGGGNDIVQIIYISFQWAMFIAWTTYIILCFAIPFVVKRKLKSEPKSPK